MYEEREGLVGWDFINCSKCFVAQETIDLNVSWSSNFFGKYFMAPRINFSFLLKAFLQQYFRIRMTVIFKFQITKGVNIHKNIQKMIFKQILQKTFNIFCHIKTLLQQ